MQNLRMLGTDDRLGIAPEIQTVWDRSSPNQDGFATVDSVAYGLSLGQQDGSLAVSDEDLLLIVDAVSQVAVNGRVNLEGFWHVMEPLIEPDITASMFHSEMSDGSSEGGDFMAKPVTGINRSNASSLRLDITRSQDRGRSAMPRLPTESCNVMSQLASCRLTAAHSTSPSPPSKAQPATPRARSFRSRSWWPTRTCSCRGAQASRAWLITHR